MRAPSSRQHRQHARRVDDRGHEQLLAQRTRRRPGRPARPASPASRDQNLARERVAVRAQSRRVQADQRVALAHALGRERLARARRPRARSPRDRGRRASSRRRARRSRRPSSAAPARRQPSATPATSTRQLRGLDVTDRHVVEHEEGLGPHAHQVVDQHRHQVDADRVVATARGARPRASCRPRRPRRPAPARRSRRRRARRGRRSRRCRRARPGERCSRRWRRCARRRRRPAAIDTPASA